MSMLKKLIFPLFVLLPVIAIAKPAVNNEITLVNHTDCLYDWATGTSTKTTPITAYIYVYDENGNFTYSNVAVPGEAQGRVPLTTLSGQPALLVGTTTSESPNSVSGQLSPTNPTVVAQVINLGQNCTVAKPCIFTVPRGGCEFGKR